MLDELAPRRSRPDSGPTRCTPAHPLRRCLALLCCSTAAGALVIAAPGPQAGDPAAHFSVWGASTGIQDDGAGLRGSGPGYKVRFDSGGVHFTAALGAKAPRNLPLGFELESIRRGGQLVYAAGSPERPERVGGAVHYRRGAGIEERYELRVAGLEQSFAFAAPLPGEGELVVRGRLRTDLPWPSPGEYAELDFRVPGLGGVHVGAVTGIDADGDRARGTLRLEGEFLELVLPADFVDAASYPLVLDPLIGPVFDVTSGADADILADVAYDATNDVYLVVWQRDFSVSDADVRGQRVLPSGALHGGQVAIEDSDGQEARYPTVASVNLSDRFLVAWQQRDVLGAPYDIAGRAIPAGSVGGSSGIVTIAAEAASERHPDAAGEPTLLDNEALVVWFEEGAGMRGAQMTVPAAGDPSAFGHFALSSNAFDNNAAISRCSDDSGRHLVVWQRLYHTPSPGDHDLRAAVIDRNGNVLMPDTSIGSEVGWDEVHPDVDGDGTSWIVAYQRDPSLGAAQHDIRALHAEWTGTSLSVGTPVALTSDPLSVDINPAVAHAGAQTFVAWSESPDAIATDLVVRGLDPQNCLTCEATSTVAATALLEGSAAIASELSGSTSAGDGALLVWHAFDGASGDGDIQAQLLEALGAGGTTANLGGGCGGGGTIATSGAIAPGNASFVGTLSGADPGAVVGLFLVRLPGPAATVSCSSCTYLQWPWAYLAAPVTSGKAKLALPIPCRASLVGKTALAQWLVWPTATTPCKSFASISMTDVLSVTFQH